MRKIIRLIKEYISTAKRFGIIQWTIILCAVFCMTLIWPAELFRVPYTSECSSEEIQPIGPVETGTKQRFFPVFEKLDSISVYVANDKETVAETKLGLFLFNKDETYLTNVVVDLSKENIPGYVTIPVDKKLDTQNRYTYIIEGIEGELLLGYCEEESKTSENSEFYYDDELQEGISAAVQYHYRRPMGLKRILFFDGVLAVGVFILLFLVWLVRRKMTRTDEGERSVWRRIEQGWKYGIAGISTAGVLTAFYGIVIKRLFEDDALNIAVLFSGVVIASVCLNIKVFCCKSELEPLAAGENGIWEKMERGIRSLLLSVVVIMCCMYINGTSNYEKGLYLRLMLVFFGLFMISTGQRKQIFHIPGLIWTLAAFGIGKYHIAQHNDHIEHTNTANREAWLIWVTGLLIIHIIYRIKDGDFKKLRHFNIPYAFFMTALFALCIVFANGKSWPAMLCVVFLIWSVIYLTADKREGIWEDICNGILLAFFGSVIFCLYRRPYQYSMLARYGGIMFTVTSTALYYLVPGAAALTKTLIARKNGSKEKVWFSWIIFGIVAAYMAFTASRTGIVAMVVMTFIALLYPWAGEKKGFIKRQLKSSAVMVVTAVLMFAATFSATRTIPAITGHPFYFFFEKPNAAITFATPWNGVAIKEDSYIEIQKVFQVLFDRVLGISIRDDSAKIQNQDYVLGELLALAAPGAISKTEDLNAGYDNGRFAIYKTYFSQLNMTGHEGMSLMGEQGEEYIHAHNSYLQAAYDFGIPTGIVFLVFCLFTFILTLIKAWKQGSTSIYAFLPLLITAGFGVASLFEWVYHPCNPLGFAFLLILPFCLEKNKSVK